MRLVTVMSCSHIMVLAGVFLVYPQAFATSLENQLLLNELLNLCESKTC